MSSPSACIVNKVQGMCHIREDVTPSVLEWKAIDQSSTITIPLNSLVNLQATKESSPKMILKVIYKKGEENADIRLSFTNRPTMNNVKDALQTIVSRQRTVVSDNLKEQSGTPGPATPTPGTPVASDSNLNITSSDALSDAKLLKNHQLQQKLLLEDKNLRNLFTQSVINFKLSPNMFWSTRLNLLRTYALTVSQHRGRYNVLSTIKPVATSDNQVNVNVTRTTINEIFETYPTVKKAFDDLVPVKFQEGEFWSRFFNSKLFRRLRGDKINHSTDRGDMILDKYLFMDKDDTKAPENIPEDDTGINKFIDLRGNELDNTVKMGNKPDITMKFENDKSNEMIILMQNMNKLSSKMIFNQEPDKRAEPSIKEYEEELNLQDLNESSDSRYIDLKINSTPVEINTVESHISADKLQEYLQSQTLHRSETGINLVESSKSEDINYAYSGINNLVKLNHRAFKIINNQLINVDANDSLISHNLVDEITSMNSTANEFLSHFWKIFLNESNPGQLKKLFNSLKNCKKKFLELKEQGITQISSKSTDKVREKNISDLTFILSPILQALDKALATYVKAVKESDDEINENGKRPLQETATT